MPSYRFGFTYQYPKPGFLSGTLHSPKVMTDAEKEEFKERIEEDGSVLMLFEEVQEQ